MDFALIAEQQQLDQQMIAHRQNNPNRYQDLEFPTATGPQQLVCYRRNDNDDWRIYIPQALVPQVVRWYHFVLGHAGHERLYKTISTHFIFPQVKEYCTYFVSECTICKQQKSTGPGYGHLPERIADSIPFDEVSVD